jgi:hypothetical protein
MKMRNAPHRRKEQVRVLRRMLEAIALISFARRIGLRRGGKLLALATAALLDQEPAKRQRTRGNEAPMVIGPRAVARLLRQFFTAIRGRRSD